MIDLSEPLENQIEKQAKIIQALIQRASRQHDVGGSAYSLFQSAITLQGEVWEKTKDLERALDNLGRTNTDLEIAEGAREQTQRNLADALDAMEGGLAIFTDGKLQICNEKFKKLLPDIAPIILPGLMFDEYFDAVKKSPFVMTTQEGDRAVPRARHENVSGNISVPFQLELKNDRWFQITHKSTNSGNIVIQQTEITSVVRKNRLEQDRLIDQQAHFLQAAFDHMKQGVCTFSSEGTLLIHNSRFGELLGLPFSLTGKGVAFDQILEFIKTHRLFDKASLNRRIATWVEKVRSGKTLKERVYHINGSILEIHVDKLPDGGFIVNIVDITAESQATDLLEKHVQERTFELTATNERLQKSHDAQEQVEEQLRIAMDEAEAAVSSKTRFFAAASHDLLQPINAGKLFISTLLESSRNTDMEETVGRLSRSFTSVESLLHAVLDISRLESTGTELSISAFAIDEILHSIKDDNTPLAAEKNLDLDVVSSSLWVKSDQRYLLRSIQNLVANAIQYTNNGRVLVGCRRRGNEVVVEVWDTGIGVSKEDQKRIFTEFTRIDSDTSGDGMGLGLSIVERACRHLNHRVKLRSKPGIGSVFSIFLPMTKPAETTVERLLKQPDAPRVDMDLIVAIIENDADVLFAMTQKIEEWGGSVLGATSTEEALKLADEIGMAPDIILADYQLNHDDNGIDTILALREQTKISIPAIMITANHEDHLTKESKKHGFTILTKPVKLSRLRPLIDWKTRSGLMG